MFPSSEIRVIEQSANKLIVLDPPYYSAGITAIVLALLGLAGFFIFRHGHRFGAIDWVGVLSAIPFLLIGVAFLTSKTVITMDYTQGKVFVKRQVFGLTRIKSELALAEVRSAAVASGTGKQAGTCLLLLVLSSGETLPLGNYSSQTGHGAVSRAMNDFLALHQSSRR